MEYCGAVSTESATKASQKKAISKAKSKLAKNLTDLENEYEKGLKDLDKVQKAYDDAETGTNHGTKQTEQNDWEQALEKKIQGVLNPDNP